MNKGAHRALIINADDFGRSTGENERIVAGIDNGMITSISVMANMPAAWQAAELARSGLGCAVHLNLSEGPPISEISKVRSLVGKNGSFSLRNTVMRKALTGSIDLDEVEAELDAQIRVACEIIGRPTHLDSHMNLHWLPGIFGRTLRLAQRWGITRMRSPKRLLASPTGIKESTAWSGVLNPLVAIRGLIKGRNHGPAKTSGLMMPSYVLTRVDSEPTVEWARRAMGALPVGICEFPVHPGWTTEYDLLGDNEFRTVLACNEVRLVDFRALDEDPVVA